MPYGPSRWRVPCGRTMRRPRRWAPSPRRPPRGAGPTRRSANCAGPPAWRPVSPTSRACCGSGRIWPLRCGRADGTDVAVAAAKVALEAGLRTQAGMLLANAGAALVRIGRWDEAGRFLQMSADVVSPHTLGSTYHLLQRSLLRLWQGEVALARADLAQILENFPDLDPQLACPIYTQLA